MRKLILCHLSWVASASFATWTIALSAVAGSLALAVYSLSFWHYYLYWLAYVFRGVSLLDFKGDAVTMKTVSLAVLAIAYFAAPLELLSLAVVTCGFALNLLAAGALGSDRTYYGYELGALPALRITAFPYSLLSHPMLVGNMTAFAGTMINEPFRERWWPLACMHVALNLGLLIMERFVAPRRRRSPPVTSIAANAGGDRRRARNKGALVVGCATLGAAFAAWSVSGSSGLLAWFIGAGMVAYACVLHYVYSMPTLVSEAGRAIHGRTAHE